MSRPTNDALAETIREAITYGERLAGAPLGDETWDDVRASFPSAREALAVLLDRAESGGPTELKGPVDLDALEKQLIDLGRGFPLGT